MKLLDNATGALDTDQPVEIFAGNVAPVNHNLHVEMIYRGDSSVFTYMNDYVFKLRANYTFYAPQGKITTVTSKGYLKGDVTYELTDRPSITFGVVQRPTPKRHSMASAVTPSRGASSRCRRRHLVERGRHALCSDVRMGHPSGDGARGFCPGRRGEQPQQYAGSIRPLSFDSITSSAL